MSARPVKLKRKSLAVQLREQMESHIREGEWSIGMKIPAEGELAKIFEVSHNTVREAVQGLIHAGMLVAKPGDGTYVTAADRLDAALDHRLEQEADKACVLQARLAIEKSIVALAAACCTEEDLSAMEAALQKCKNREGKGIEADMAFHCLIADATRNPILSQIYRVISGHLSRHLGDTLCEPQYNPIAIELHDSLLAALRRRDVESAQKAIEGIINFDMIYL